MDLKTMAVSRLMLDNFPHIKAYWIMLGIQTAQLSLSYGADDIDGTVVHEMIYHDAGSDSPQELTVAQLRRLIEEAGRVPIERDTLYRKVERQEGHWKVGAAVDADHSLREGRSAVECLDQTWQRTSGFGPKRSHDTH